MRVFDSMGDRPVLRQLSHRRNVAGGAGAMAAPAAVRCYRSGSHGVGDPTSFCLHQCSCGLPDALSYLRFLSRSGMRPTFDRSHICIAMDLQAVLDERRNQRIVARVVTVSGRGGADGASCGGREPVQIAHQPVHEQAQPLGLGERRVVENGRVVVERESRAGERAPVRRLLVRRVRAVRVGVGAIGRRRGSGHSVRVRVGSHAQARPPWAWADDGRVAVGVRRPNGALPGLDAWRVGGADASALPRLWSAPLCDSKTA